MDIPKFSSLQGSVIDFELGGEAFKMNVGHASGHRGGQHGYVTIQGVFHGAADLEQPCTVAFEGQKFAGTFKEISGPAGAQTATMEAVILEPSFWQ